MNGSSVLRFLKKKMTGKTLKPAMNSEVTMEVSTEQDISTDHPVPASFLTNQNPIFRPNKIALSILDYVVCH